MKIPVGIVLLVLGAFLSLQTWTLKEVVNLKVAVAGLTSRVDLLGPKTHIASNP